MSAAAIEAVQRLAQAALDSSGEDAHAAIHEDLNLVEAQLRDILPPDAKATAMRLSLDPADRATVRGRLFSIDLTNGKDDEESELLPTGEFRVGVHVYPQEPEVAS